MMTACIFCLTTVFPAHAGLIPLLKQWAIHQAHVFPAHAGLILAARYGTSWQQLVFPAHAGLILPSLA